MNWTMNKITMWMELEETALRLREKPGNYRGKI